MPYKNLIVFALFAPTHSVLKNIFSDLFPKSQYPISWVSHCQAWNGIKNYTQMYVVYLTQAKFYQMTSVCDLKQTGSTAVGGPIPQTTLPCCDLLSPQHCLISHTSLPTSDLVSLIFNGTRDHPLRCNSRLNTEWKIQISPVLWVCGLISHTAPRPNSIVLCCWWDFRSDADLAYAITSSKALYGSPLNLVNCHGKKAVSPTQEEV